MTYLRNTWYVAGMQDELLPGQLLARTYLDEPVVLFRNAAGEPQALVDRCPHRFAPLSAGKLCDSGNSLQCGYHGLQFNGKGACISNPHGDGKIPSAAVVRSYPIVEKFGLLWIWMGEVALADAATIPDMSCFDRKDNHVASSYLLIESNYTLETDNILDLSHIEFLHPGSLGSDAVKSALTEVKQEGDTVWSMRQTVNEIMPELLYHMTGMQPGTPVDRWIDVRWNAPANMLLFAGATETGRPRSEGRASEFPHLFTPQTKKSTHYWFAVCLNKLDWPDGAQRAPMTLQGITGPFTHEDKPMLEFQQARMGDADFWSLKPVLLPSDAPGVRARRVLDGLIAAEQRALNGE